MKEQANKFVQHYGSAAATSRPERGSHQAPGWHENSWPGTSQFADDGLPLEPATRSSSQSSGTGSRSARLGGGGGGNDLQVRRKLRVKIRKSKPILGIAIEGGFNVSGQLLPRIVCVHVSTRQAPLDRRRPTKERIDKFPRLELNV